MSQIRRAIAAGARVLLLPLVLVGLIAVVVAASPNRAGSAPRPLLDNGRIAFMSDRALSETFDIFTMNPDGSDQTNVTNSERSECLPDWSPNGTSIAFSAGPLCFEDIFVMNADGSGETNLTNDAAYDLGPDWSSDGTRIAFASGPTSRTAAPHMTRTQPGRLMERESRSPRPTPETPATFG